MGSKFSFYDHQGALRSGQLSSEKRKKQTKNLFKFLIIAVVVLLGLILAVQVPSLLKQLTNPFREIQNELVNNIKVNYGFRTNILLVTFQDDSLLEISLGSLHPSDKKVQILKLNPQQRVFGKDKDYTLDSIFSSKKTDKKYFEKLTAKITESLGLVLDGYIVIEDQSTWQDKNKLEELINDLYSPSFFLQILNKRNYLDAHLSTNLSLGELNSLASSIKDLRPERFVVIEVGESQVPLTPAVLTEDPTIQISDANIVEEDVTVEIVNASGIDGTGSIFKNLLNNMGARVVELDTGETQDKSEILRKEKTKLEERLINLLNKELKVSSDKQISTDIKLIIGKDLADYFDF